MCLLYDTQKFAKEMSSDLNISGAFAVFFLDLKFSNKFEQITENANIFSVTSNTARNGHYNISHCIEAGLIGTNSKSNEFKLVSLNFELILSNANLVSYEPLCNKSDVLDREHLGLCV
jgi:hypothetical protein